MSTHGDVDATADSETAVLRRIGQFSWSALGIIALIGVVAFLIIEARIILAPLFLAMVVVFILNPLVSMLERMRIHRILGTTLGFLIIIVALVVAVALVIPSVVEQGQMFASDFPDLYDDLTAPTITIAARLNTAVSLWDYDRLVLEEYSDAILVHDCEKGTPNPPTGKTSRTLPSCRLRPSRRARDG